MNQTPRADAPRPATNSNGQARPAAAPGNAGARRPVQTAQKAGRIGRIVSVSGSQAVIQLEQGLKVNADGHSEIPQIGTLVRMATKHSSVFGIVSGLNIPVPAHDGQDAEMRILELDFIGESIVKPGSSKAQFQRGISFYPSLGDEAFAASAEDLKAIYAQPNAACVRVGTICQDQTLPAYVTVDELLGKHFAILGTTGSGKSCTVALILRAILSQNTGGHIVLLDVHSEYASSFADTAEVLRSDTLDLPYWLLNFEELREIVIGRTQADREADQAILKEAVLYAKLKGTDSEEKGTYVTADTPIPYRLSEVVRHIDDALGKMEKATDSGPYLRLKERLTTLQNDKRYAFMFPGVTVRDNMAAILSRIFRVPVDGKPITILDLSGVPSEIMNVVISLLCRLTFDFALWSDRALPILLVCEEAQRYMGHDATLGFEPTKRALARIAKEGRKYGVSLGLVSQRPADLAVEILSQCNTIFAMRMSNRKDQDFVRATLSESTVGLIDILPTLRTGEAIAVGEGVSVPARLMFDLVPDEFRPHSGTASFSKAWQSEGKDASFVSEVVRRWRRQGR
jgi:DNA helicase HerA-like ATPase